MCLLLNGTRVVQHWPEAQRIGVDHRMTGEGKTHGSKGRQNPPIALITRARQAIQLYPRATRQEVVRLIPDVMAFLSATFRETTEAEEASQKTVKKGSKK